MKGRWIPCLGAAFFLILIAACSESPDLTVEISLAANQTNNPLIQIDNDLKSGASSGIYFQLDQLHCPPANIDDVVSGGSVVKVPNPDAGEGGSAPLTDQFNIQSNLLLDRTFYRVMMYERYEGVLRYKGVGDCPVNLALGESNKSTICFGLAGSTPVCPDLTAQWSNCPGVTDATYCN